MIDVRIEKKQEDAAWSVVNGVCVFPGIEFHTTQPHLVAPYPLDDSS
jgi:hypothetical protein